MTTDSQSPEPPDPPEEIVEQLHAWAIANNLVVDLHIVPYPNSNQPRRSPGLAIAFTITSTKQQRSSLSAGQVARLHAAIDRLTHPTSDCG